MELIVSSGVNLRKLVEADAAKLFSVVQENQDWFAQFDFLAPSFADFNDARKWILGSQLDQNLSRTVFGLWQDSNLIGVFKINKINHENGSADLGYWMTRVAAGHGYANKAFQRLIEYCLNDMNVKSLQATTSATNEASIRLLERAGFRKKAVLQSHVEIKGRQVDDILFELLPEFK